MTVTQTILQNNCPEYYGHILKGNYSDSLKKLIIQYINTFKLLEKTGSPAMLYIASWNEQEKSIKNIWYEYICKKISSLLKCHPSDTADAFRKSVIESRIYKYDTVHENINIQKKDINKTSLNCERNSIRSESVSAGVTEAVYKIRLSDDHHIWLNDKANIKKYQEDGTYISLGSLTDVTKEMKAEEERESLLSQLREALNNVKILSGLVPICASCKQIRDDQGYWNQIDEYITRHSDVKFSHGICPDCAKKLYPDYFKK